MLVVWFTLPVVDVESAKDFLDPFGNLILCTVANKFGRGTARNDIILEHGN